MSTNDEKLLAWVLESAGALASAMIVSAVVIAHASPPWGIVLATILFDVMAVRRFVGAYPRDSKNATDA